MIRRRLTTTFDAPDANHLSAEPFLPPSSPSRPPYNPINPTAADRATATTKMGSRSSWLFYAVASGACASFNGVFAKLYNSGYYHCCAARIDNHTDLIEGPRPNSLALSPPTSRRSSIWELGAVWWNTLSELFVYHFLPILLKGRLRNSNCLSCHLIPNHAFLWLGLPSGCTKFFERVWSRSYRPPLYPEELALDQISFALHRHISINIYPPSIPSNSSSCSYSFSPTTLCRICSSSIQLCFLCLSGTQCCLLSLSSSLACQIHPK